MTDGQPAQGGSPRENGVLKSSTFKQALAVCLLVWLLGVAALWTSRHLEPVETLKSVRSEVEVSSAGFLQALVIAEMEHRIERELEDEEENETFQPDELEFEDFESDVFEDEEDEQEDEEENEEENEERLEAEHAELLRSLRFEANNWSLERLTTFLHEAEEIREWFAEEDLCWQLLDTDGRWVDGSLSATESSELAGRRVEARVGSDLLLASGVHVDINPREALEELVESRLEWDHSDPEDLQHCLLREVRLSDGASLRLGHEFEPFRLQLLHVTTAALLLLGLAVAFGGCYLLARRAVHFVDDLRRARSRLEGKAFPRLRRPGDHGDFDRAASEINAILERLDGALGSLTHVTDNIAHDLRTPLTRLQGQLDILRRSGKPTEGMISAVQEEADQLVATFNALLRIAQVESGHRRRGFRPFDLALVVSDVCDLYSPAFAEVSLSFECRLPSSSLERDGDPDLWMQALSNLLDNALKYNSQGGRVELELRPGPQPQIILRDDGPGIPESERDRVLERFYRPERDHGEVRGAGLGLSLVAAVCKLHDATLSLEGDRGLTVRIAWPRRADVSQSVRTHDLTS